MLDWHGKFPHVKANFLSMETFPETFCLRLGLLLSGGEMFELCLQTLIICANTELSVTKLFHIFSIFSSHRIDWTDSTRERQIWPGLNLDSEMYSLNSFNAGEEFLNQYNLELSLFSDQFWSVVAVSFAQNIWSHFKINQFSALSGSNGAEQYCPF